MSKPIVFIGGTAGTGKTTIAKRIADKYEICHRIETGYVRGMVKSQTTTEADPQLSTSTFNSDDPIGNLNYQADSLHNAVLSCIKRAKTKEAALIMEGAHLTPKLYHGNPDIVYIVLTNSDPENFKQRFKDSGDKKRDISDSQFENILRIQEHIVADARKRGAHIVENTDIESTYQRVCKILEERGF